MTPLEFSLSFGQIRIKAKFDLHARTMENGERIIHLGFTMSAPLSRAIARVTPYRRGHALS